MSTFDPYDPYRKRSPSERLKLFLGALVGRVRAFLSIIWHDYVLGFFGFLGELASRVWHGLTAFRLLRAAPAFVFLSCGLVFVLLLWVTPDRPRRDRYTALAQSALRRGDVDTARIGFLRLLRWGLAPQEVQFGLAACLLAKGDARRAVPMLERIAPEDRPGYGPAHFLLGQGVLTQPQCSVEDLRRAERHLLLATRQDARLTQAHALLGQLYYQLGPDRWLEAREQLLKVSPREPKQDLLLARIATQTADADAAKRFGLDALAGFRRQVEATPGDLNARMGWADTLVVLGDFGEASKVATQALAQARSQAEEARLHEYLGRLYLAWFMTESAKPAPNLPRCFELLEQGLLHNPRESGLLQALLELTHGTGELALQARNRLRELSISGQASATLHLCLGIDCWRRGQLEEAILQLELAFKLDARMPYVANNLAWLLNCQSPPNTERALEVINSVLRVFPNHPEFRDTRGQILANAKRHREALEDLTFALAHLPKDSPSLKPLHEALASAYDGLGLGDQAMQHRQKAMQLGKTGNR